MAVLALAACSSASNASGTRGSLRGLVTSVETERNQQVVVFAVRDDAGKQTSFQYETGPNQPLDVGYLREHMEKKLPVTVNFSRVGNSRAVALEILD